MPFLHGIRDINVAREAPKRCTFKRKQQTCQEGSNGIRTETLRNNYIQGRTTCNGIREQSRRQQLQLVSMGNVNKTFRETLELKITKRIAGASIRLWKMNYATLCRGQPPPK
jgi:hypothetical protein